MRKMYLSAPLPFVGQKRMFAREFIKVLGQFPDSTVFVDLFGGSGLLSHITKCVRPDATVVYNDFDNYRCRLVNIPATNVLLSDLRRIAEGEPRNKRITGEVRDKMFARIERERKRARLRGLYHGFRILVVRHEICDQFGRNEERSHLQ